MKARKNPNVLSIYSVACRAGSRFRPLAKPWSLLLSARIARYLALASTAFVASQTALAGNTWDGGGGNDDWGTADNWDPNGAPAPGSGNDLFFAGTTRLTPVNNYADFDDWRHITFNSGAGSFNITGNAIDLFGKIENSGSNTQTFNLTIGTGSVSGGFIEMNPVSGNLNVGGANVFLGNNQLRVFGDNGNTLTFGTGTIISGTSGTVAINQNSTVVYQSAHTYTGGTFINAGTLQFNAGGSASSSALQLGDTSGTKNASLFIGGALTVGNTITVRSGSTANTLTLGGSTADASIFSGAINLGTASGTAKGATLVALSGGSVDFQGVINESSSVPASDIAIGDATHTGTVKLSNAANAYSGITTINNGATIEATKLNTGGSNSSIGNSAGAATNLIFSGGTLKYTGTGDSTNRLFTFDTNGATVDASATANGALNFTGTGSLVASGTGNRTLTLTGSSTGSNTLTSVIANPSSGATSLTKSGVGTWVVGGANTYTGATLVSDGTLSVSTVATGSAAQSLGAGTVVNLGVGNTSSGILKYTGAAGTLDKAINALGNGSDRILNSGSGLLTLSGTLTKNGTTLTLSGGANGIKVSGQIVGSSANSDLTIDGGTTTLTNNNTYNGATVVTSTGTLKIDNGGANAGQLSATTGITVNNGGSLILAGTSTTAERINNNADLTLAGGTFGFEYGLHGATETMASLTLSANSTLDFGTGSYASDAGNTLRFSTLDLSGYTLTIYNWTGPYYAQGATTDTGTANQDRLLFASGGLTGNNLSHVSFYSDAGTTFLGTGQQIAFGVPFPDELVPVPEPTTIFGALALLGLVGFRERLRLRGLMARLSARA